MMFVYQCLNLSLAKKRKDPDPFLGIGILGIEPELIELIGSGPLRIKPNISLFSFTKFTSISLFPVAQRIKRIINFTATNPQL